MEKKIYKWILDNPLTDFAGRKSYEYGVVCGIVITTDIDQVKEILKRHSEDTYDYFDHQENLDNVKIEEIDMNNEFIRIADYIE